VSFKIIMATSVTKQCFTTHHQVQDQDLQDQDQSVQDQLNKTKIDFFGVRPVLS